MSAKISPNSIEVLRFLWEMQTDGREGFPPARSLSVRKFDRVRLEDGVPKYLLEAEFYFCAVRGICHHVDGHGNPTFERLEPILSGLGIRHLVEERQTVAVRRVAYRAHNGLIVRVQDVDGQPGWIEATVDFEDGGLHRFPVQCFAGVPDKHTPLKSKRLFKPQYITKGYLLTDKGADLLDPDGAKAVKPETVAVRERDVRILTELANHHPMTMGQDAIAAAKETGCRDTVGRRLKALLALGLVSQPHGERGGWCITEKGRASLPADADSNLALTRR